MTPLCMRKLESLRRKMGYFHSFRGYVVISPNMLLISLSHQSEPAIIAELLSVVILDQTVVKT